MLISLSSARTVFLNPHLIILLLGCASVQIATGAGERHDEVWGVIKSIMKAEGEDSTMLSRLLAKAKRRGPATTTSPTSPTAMRATGSHGHQQHRGLSPAPADGINSAGWSRGLSPAPSDEQRAEDEWRKNAIKKMWEERRAMEYTPIIRFEHLKNVLILFKDESASHTQSLKHRYAWALFLWAILEGHIGPNTTVYEASSGNTANSEAYMASLLGIEFVAVVPEGTEAAKISNIEGRGGRVIKTPLGKLQVSLQVRARQEANRDPNGYFINQFGNSDAAEEYHTSGDAPLESTNVFHEIMVQLMPDDLVPDHFVHTAGTGGTISSVGRYVKKYSLATEVVLADSEFSIYYDVVMRGKYKSGAGGGCHWVPPGISGAGFGSMGPAIKGNTSSLCPSVIDRAIKVPDLASVAAMYVLRDRFGINGGPTTGLNFITSLRVAGTTFRDPHFKWSRRQQERGDRSHSTVVATLLADGGHNYAATYFNPEWVDEKFSPHGGWPLLQCWKEVILGYLETQPQPDNLAARDPITVGSEKCPSPLQKHMDDRARA